jgi:hypothetical protein
MNMHSAALTETPRKKKPDASAWKRRLSITRSSLTALLISRVGIGFSGEQLTERLMLSPNEGIHCSLKNGLLIGLVFGPGAGLLIGLGAGLVAAPLQPHFQN